MPHSYLTVGVHYSYLNLGFDTEITQCIRAIAIAKHPEFVAGHIACSNTEKSRAIIKQINQAMLLIYRQQEYLNIYFHHLPKDVHDLVTRRIADLFVSINSN